MGMGWTCPKEGKRSGRKEAQWTGTLKGVEAEEEQELEEITEEEALKEGKTWIEITNLGAPYGCLCSSWEYNMNNNYNNENLLILQRQWTDIFPLTL
jgi:hypothetical protein